MSQSVAGLAASRALHRAYWFYRAYRVEKALLDLREAVERKYGYDPNQPRVPAGNGHGLETFDDLTWLVRKNAVAHCKFDDQTFFGVNSKENTSFTRHNDNGRWLK